VSTEIFAGEWSLSSLVRTERLWLQNSQKRFFSFKLVFPNVK